MHMRQLYVIRANIIGIRVALTSDGGTASAGLFIPGL